MFPLRYCPIQIELELVRNDADAVFADTASTDEHNDNWDASDVQCKCDLLTKLMWHPALKDTASRQADNGQEAS